MVLAVVVTARAVLLYKPTVELLCPAENLLIVVGVAVSGSRTVEDLTGL